MLVSVVKVVGVDVTEEVTVVLVVGDVVRVLVLVNVGDIVAVFV